MYDRIREALQLNPSEENTLQVDVFLGSPAPRFTIKSEIEDNEEDAPPFILNTPTHRMSERQVMIALYLLEVKDDWSEGDLCHICQGMRVKVRVEMTLKVRGTRPGEDHKAPRLHHPQEEGEEDLIPPWMTTTTTTGIVTSTGMHT